MSRGRCTGGLIILLVGALFTTTGAAADSVDLSEGPGKKLVQNVCQKCHELDIVVATRRSPKEWAAVVAQMITRGAILDDSEVTTIVTYLSENYGSDDVSEAKPAPRSEGSTDGPAALLLATVRGPSYELALLNPATAMVLDRIPLENAPRSVAVSGDGRIAFVTNGGGGAFRNGLAIVDLPSRRVLRQLDLGAESQPRDVTFAAGHAYFVEQGTMLVGRYDPNTDAIDLILGTGQPGMTDLAVSHDGNRIYATCPNSNAVTLLRPRLNHTGWEATTIAVGSMPRGIDLSPDGREVWVANSLSHSISIIDTARNLVTSKVDVKVPLDKLKFSSDGKVVVATTLSGYTVIVDVSRRSVVTQIALGRAIRGLALSRDGHYAYVAVEETTAPLQEPSGGLIVIDVLRRTQLKTMSAAVGMESLAMVEISK
jgi:YVTN family beta-propeller protein